MELIGRPRRNRRSEAIRTLMRENAVTPGDLIWPVFLVEGSNTRIPVTSMPGVDRMSLDLLVAEARAAHALGIPALALFPVVPDELKDPTASESTNSEGLLQRAIRALKDAVPELALITDVAMDPYSSDGHDGLVENGRILNDETLPILAEMAIAQAEAGAR